MCSLSIPKNLKYKFFKDKGFKLDISSEPIVKIDRYINILYAKSKKIDKHETVDIDRENMDIY